MAPHVPRLAFLAAAWSSAVGAGDTCLPCSSEADPAPGDEPSSLNGIRWPTLCIDDRGQAERHFFTIGDWGGMGPLYPPKPFDNTQKKRPFVKGIDDSAQMKVAAVMKDVAKTSHPAFLLNVGDNFYPGGYETNCGQTNMCNVIHTGQWHTVFERVYDGPDLLRAPWMGVLGNHDYGGHHFNKGWDQSVAYTWHSDRWLTPALYWERHVQYCDFSLDIYFLDTNFNDVFPTHHDPNHNICSHLHNMVSNCKDCGGPGSAEDCTKWFKKLELEQKAWLERRLAQSDADWQIIVTHFPPQWQARYWERIAATYGVDLFVTGHRHQQEVHYKDGALRGLGDTAWVVTGGGGGVTSEGNPEYESPRLQQYGFMDITISKESLTIDMWSFTGKKKSSTVVMPRPRTSRVPQMPSPSLKPVVPALNGSGLDMRTAQGFAPSIGNVSEVTVATEGAACASHPGCAQLSGQCCPNDGGQFLSCCEVAESSRATAGLEVTTVRKLSKKCDASRRRDASPGSRRRVMHYSLNCWPECGHSGYCGYCGEGNACCRHGAKDDPVECQGVYFPVIGWHTCVRPLGGRLVELGSKPVLVLDTMGAATDTDISMDIEAESEANDMEIKYLDDGSLDMLVDLSRENCFEPCGSKAGMCDFYCGAGRACCKKDSPEGPEECKGTNPYGFLTDHYECVMVMSGHPSGEGAWGASRSETVAVGAVLEAASAGATSFAGSEAAAEAGDAWSGSLSMTLWHGLIGYLVLGTSIACFVLLALLSIFGTWSFSSLICGKDGEWKSRGAQLDADAAGQPYIAAQTQDEDEEEPSATLPKALASGVVAPAPTSYRIVAPSLVALPAGVPPPGGAWVGQRTVTWTSGSVVRAGTPVLAPSP